MWIKERSAFEYKSLNIILEICQILKSHPEKLIKSFVQFNDFNQTISLDHKIECHQTIQLIDLLHNHRRLSNDWNHIDVCTKPAITEQLINQFDSLRCVQ